MNNEEHVRNFFQLPETSLFSLVWNMLGAQKPPSLARGMLESKVEHICIYAYQGHTKIIGLLNCNVDVIVESQPLEHILKFVPHAFQYISVCNPKFEQEYNKLGRGILIYEPWSPVYELYADLICLPLWDIEEAVCALLGVAYGCTYDQIPPNKLIGTFKWALFGYYLQDFIQMQKRVERATLAGKLQYYDKEAKVFEPSSVLKWGLSEGIGVNTLIQTAFLKNTKKPVRHWQSTTLRPVNIEEKMTSILDQPENADKAREEIFASVKESLAPSHVGVRPLKAAWDKVAPLQRKKAGRRRKAK